MINKIFIINNKKHIDRLEKTLQEIGGTKGDVYISRAIYPSERKIPFRKRFDKLKDGELGCLLSHREIWKKIASEKTKNYTVILEDDIALNDEIDLLKVSSQLLNKLKYKPNIFFLGSFDGRVKLKRSKKKTIVIGENTFFVGEPLPQSIWCTYGYMINSIGAGKLLYATRKGSRPVDYFYTYLNDLDDIRPDDYCAVVPNIVLPRGEVSTIQDVEKTFISSLKKFYVDFKNEMLAFFS